jgi:hypothetical protein
MTALTVDICMAALTALLHGKIISQFAVANISLLKMSPSELRALPLGVAGRTHWPLLNLFPFLFFSLSLLHRLLYYQKKRRKVLRIA